MKKITGLLLFALFCASSMLAQTVNDPVLMIVGHDTVRKSEFVRIYKKNAGESPSYDKKSLDDYLDLAVNFHLKVVDAEAQGIDKRPEVAEELEMYQEQLKQPYLIDNEMQEKLLKEAYEHMRYDYHAAHILFRVPKDPTPADTLAAYNKAMKARARILKGDRFQVVAAEMSEDPKAKRDSGDMSYFTAFGVVYPFECAVYELKGGGVSYPVRTEYGYHIIKLIDQEPALGKIKASHVLVNVPQSADPVEVETAKRKIDSAYALLQKGKSFEEVARSFSDDKSSLIRGGMLAEFNVSRMVPEFIEQLYHLKPEQYSKPFRTQFGYHIVQFHSATGVESYEAARVELINRLYRDPRSKLIQTSFIQKLKKEYNYTETKGAYEQFLTLVDDHILQGEWTFTNDEKFNKPLFKLGDSVAKFSTFASYLAERQSQTFDVNMTIPKYVKPYYDNFVDDYCVNYEAQQLPRKYPEYDDLLKEYKEGILLFELTNEKVWQRSLTDTAGLSEYYELQKHCRMWPPRANAVIFTYDVRYINTDEVRAFMEKNYRKGKEKKIADVKNAAAKKFDTAHYTIVYGVFEPSQDKVLDKVTWEKGLSRDVLSGRPLEKGFVYIYDVYPATCKTLEETRGAVIADYQTYLENEWLKELKAKYPVVIDRKVFNSLIR